MPILPSPGNPDPHRWATLLVEWLTNVTMHGTPKQILVTVLVLGMVAAQAISVAMLLKG